MKDSASLSYSGGDRIDGRIEVTESELIFYEKHIPTICTLFGLLGVLLADALIRGQEYIRIRLSDIAAVRKSPGLKDCMREIELKNGITYVIAFRGSGEALEYLEYAMSLRGNQQATSSAMFR
jgi:hypothetical protein